MESTAPMRERFARRERFSAGCQSDLLAALGAFTMLMPGIVIIDRRSEVGNEALLHIEDVLHTIPQPMLVIIELGVPDCMAQHGAVLHLGAPADASPVAVLSQAKWIG
jgi:hypothetical protein